MATNKKALLFNGASVCTIAFILISGPLFIHNIPFLLMQVFGLLLIFWALLARNVNKHRHEDKLPRGSFLITKGPYEIIRHPVYAGILLIMAGYVQGYITLPRYLALFLLIFFVFLKMIYEESILEQKVKEYKDYQKKTHKLIPYFY